MFEAMILFSTKDWYERIVELRGRFSRNRIRS